MIVARKRSVSVWFGIMLAIAMLAVFFSGCASKSETAGSTKPDNTSSSGGKEEISGRIRIGIQHGFGYAPLLLMNELDLLKKRLPGVDIEIVQMTSATPLTELMINGDVDIAQIGTAPFLIAWDKGVPVKLVGTSMVFPMDLVTWKEDLKTLADIKPEDRLAMPATTSAQYFYFAMALEQQLGDSHKYDQNVVAMALPDAFAAMKSKKEIVAHYATPPVLFEELKLPGYHSITSVKDTFGHHHYSPIAVSDAYYQKNREIVDAFVEALEESQSILRDEPEEAAKVLAPILKYDEKTTLEYLTWEGMEYTSKLRGTMKLADFMHAKGYISKKPSAFSEVTIEGAEGD